MKEFLQEAQALQEELVTWRRHLHQNPEVGMEIPNTASFVKQKLEEMGYEASYVGGHGVTALAGGQKPGKCFLIRGDMDALPVKEEADCEFKSENGNMHACGHDFHTAMLLGAAKLLKARENEINGWVKFMFQPGEEVLAGAKAMVEDGILENPKVDAAAMIHISAGMPLPTGLIMLPGGGPYSAASDWFEITIKGRGGHGAMPESAIDPLNVISHLHISLQAINSREVAAGEPAVVTVGIMQGGEASNVIPDTAIMKGTIRTYSKEVRAHILKRVPAISNSVAETFRAEAEPVIIEGCPSVEIDQGVADTIRTGLKAVFGEDAVIDPAVHGSTRMTGSEDFSFVTQEVPSVMMVLTAGNPSEGHAYPMHHPKASFDESVLHRGAAAYAISALSWLNNN